MTTLNNVFIPGSLKVKTITGKNGDFQVAEISLPFADVEANEPWVEQYEDGEYTGRFLIERVFIKAVPVRGGAGIMNVLKARIPEAIIEEADEGAETGLTDFVKVEIEPEQEPTPIDTPKPQETVESAKADDIDIGFTVEPEEQTDVQRLFGKYFGLDCKTLDDLPDVLNLKQIDEDLISDRNKLREIAGLLNHKKGGTFKFVPQSNTWERVCKLADVSE